MFSTVLIIQFRLRRMIGVQTSPPPPSPALALPGSGRRSVYGLIACSVEALNRGSLILCLLKKEVFLFQFSPLQSPPPPSIALALPGSGRRSAY